MRRRLIVCLSLDFILRCSVLLKIPIIKKKVKDFLLGEEGFISKDKAISLGLIASLAALSSKPVAAYHASVDVDAESRPLMEVDFKEDCIPPAGYYPVVDDALMCAEEDVCHVSDGHSSDGPPAHSNAHCSSADAPEEDTIEFPDVFHKNLLDLRTNPTDESIITAFHSHNLASCEVHVNYSAHDNYACCSHAHVADWGKCEEEPDVSPKTARIILD